MTTSPQLLTKDECIKIIIQQMRDFAAENKISEDQAIDILRKAEKTPELQECKETHPLKINEATINIAQKLLVEELKNNKTLKI